MYATRVLCNVYVCVCMELYLLHVYYDEPGCGVFYLFITLCNQVTCALFEEPGCTYATRVLCDVYVVSGIYVYVMNLNTQSICISVSIPYATSKM